MGKVLRTIKGTISRALLALCMIMLLLAVQAAAGGAAASALAASPPVVGGKAVVANTGGDPIRVREGPGTTYSKLTSAYEGQTVSVLDGPSSDTSSKEWYKVQTPSGIAGWMSGDFLQSTGAAPSTASQTSKLTGIARVANTDGDPLRMRAAPTVGAKGNVLTLLDPGATVNIEAGPLTDDTGVVWYQITAKGLTGWAMAKYLDQAESAPAQATNPSVEKTPTPVKAVVGAKPAATATAAKPVVSPKTQPVATPTAKLAGATPTLAQYRQWMEEARTTFPYAQSVDKMWSVMMCESGGNPSASGGGGAWLGLFQYSPGTWAGGWNPYRSNSIWDAKSQIFATAKAWSIGMQGAWSCYYGTPGR